MRRWGGIARAYNGDPLYCSQFTKIQRDQETIFMLVENLDSFSILKI